MINFKKWLMWGAAAVASLGFFACSDSDDTQAEVTPLFDEPLAIQCEANSSSTIEFSSPLDWKLSSSAIWCTLSQDGEFFAYDIAGKAGSHNIIINVSDDSQNFEASSATLTMTRCGQSEIIATVYRSGKEHELTIFDSDGAPVESIAIGYNGIINFAVEANFEFAVVEQPEWLDELLVASDASDKNKKNYSASIVADYKPLPCSGTLLLADEERNVVYPCSITYTGMNPTSVIIEGENAWYWSLSADGKTFSNTSAINSSEIVYTDAIPFSIKTLNYDCRYVCFEEGENDNLDLMTDDSWIKVAVSSENPSEISVSGEAYPAETTGSRTGYLFAVPAAYYEAFMAKYRETPTISFAQDSVANNLVLNVTQSSDYVDETAGFKVMHKMVTEIACVEETDAAYLSLLKENYSLTDVYSVSVESGMALQMFPHLADDKWEGWRTTSTIITDANGNEIDPATVGFEVAMDDQDNYYISVTSQSHPIIIILKGVDGSYLKAMVVKAGVSLDPGTGFKVMHMMIDEVACALEEDENLAVSIIEKYSTNVIYSAPVTAGKFYQIYPNLTDAEWEGWLTASTQVFDTDSNEIPLTDVEFEGALDENDKFYITVKALNKPIIILFKGVNGNYLKAMVLKPQTV